MNWREHLTMNAVVLIPPAFIAGKLETPIETVGVFLAGYIASTFWLNPDLDIKNSQPTKNWHFFRFIWIPYQSLRHRSIFSHGPIIGTIGRLLYLHVVLLLALECGRETVEYMPEEITG